MKHYSETLTTKDNCKISINIYKNSHPTVVVVCPGFFQSKETKTFVRISSMLTDNYDVVSMDFRGHGKSSGRYSFSANEYMDLEAVLNYANRYYKKVGILAFSLGGSVAIEELTLYKNAHSLISVSTPMNFTDIEYRVLNKETLKVALKNIENGLGVRPGNILLKKAKPIDLVDKLSPIPVLFIHGKNDPVVYMRHSVSLFEKANFPKAIEIFENGHHSEEIFRRYPDRFERVVKDWFNKTLGTEDESDMTTYAIQIPKNGRILDKKGHFLGEAQEDKVLIYCRKCKEFVMAK
ncbi:MAG: alpha/beta hydrolase [Candidatus Omnitrophica bacterium]|nr:alpha/beta hydrolase [Candidatus Omnitrophota bacterium]